MFSNSKKYLEKLYKKVSLKCCWKKRHICIIHHWDSTAELFSQKRRRRKNKNHPPSASPIYIWHSREMCRPLFFFYPQRESSSFLFLCEMAPIHQSACPGSSDFQRDWHSQITAAAPENKDPSIWDKTKINVCFSFFYLVTSSHDIIVIIIKTLFKVKNLIFKNCFK